jgi:murein endopeptidase
LALGLCGQVPSPLRWEVLAFSKNRTFAPLVELLAALRRFDRRLLDLYTEIRGDLTNRVASSTRVHHLFHQLTFDADVRLHMTERLIAAG